MREILIAKKVKIKKSKKLSYFVLFTLLFSFFVLFLILFLLPPVQIFIPKRIFSVSGQATLVLKIKFLRAPSFLEAYAFFDGVKTPLECSSVGSLEYICIKRVRVPKNKFSVEFYVYSDVAKLKIKKELFAESFIKLDAPQISIETKALSPEFSKLRIHVIDPNCDFLMNSVRYFAYLEGKTIVKDTPMKCKGSPCEAMCEAVFSNFDEFTEDKNASFSFICLDHSANISMNFGKIFVTKYSDNLKPSIKLISDPILYTYKMNRISLKAYGYGISNLTAILLSKDKNYNIAKSPLRCSQINYIKRTCEAFLQFKEFAKRASLLIIGEDVFGKEFFEEFPVTIDPLEIKVFPDNNVISFQIASNGFPKIYKVKLVSDSNELYLNVDSSCKGDDKNKRCQIPLNSVKTPLIIIAIDDYNREFVKKVE